MRSVFLWSFTCLGCAAWVRCSADGPAKHCLSAGCSPPPATLLGPSLPSPEEHMQRPARQMLQEMVGQGNPHCGHTEVGRGTEDRQEDALECPGVAEEARRWERKVHKSRAMFGFVSNLSASASMMLQVKNKAAHAAPVPHTACRGPVAPRTGISPLSHLAVPSGTPKGREHPMGGPC